MIRVVKWIRLMVNWFVLTINLFLAGSAHCLFLAGSAHCLAMGVRGAIVAALCLVASSALLTEAAADFEFAKFFHGCQTLDLQPFLIIG